MTKPQTEAERMAINYSSDSIDHARMLKLAFLAGVQWTIEQAEKLHKTAGRNNGFLLIEDLKKLLDE